MKKALFLSLFFSFLSNAQLIDVWDFGATQLNSEVYNNKLTESIINSWYGATPPGTSGVNMPVAFTEGQLSWVGNSGDRLRTINVNLSRFDNNIASVNNFLGRVYCNGNVALSNGLPTNRYMRLSLNEDDEVTIITRGDTDGLMMFINENNPALQTNSGATTSASGQTTELNFVAQTTANYRIYDAIGKASFYRILRKDAVYTTVSGNVDVSNAPGIPANYQLVFTNAAGKSWITNLTNNDYSVTIPVGYDYNLSLNNANGFVIESGQTINTSGFGSTANHDVVISNVSLVNLTGVITGLSSQIDSLSLSFTPSPESGSIFIPSPIIDINNSNYSVQLDSGVEYVISANGVNDYELNPQNISITENSILNLNFSPKITYPITVNINGLTNEQLNNLILTFNNINEIGYSYSFSDLSNISLRTGVYQITYSGLNQYPVELALTSNLIVNDNAVSKSLNFNPVSIWQFNDQAINSTTQAYYKGLELNGQITTVIASGHLTARSGSSILVPISPGYKLMASYYFSANFTIEGLNFSTTSGTTSVVENAQYVYTGLEDGYVTITMGGPTNYTTYFPELKVVPNIDYTPEIFVGVDKDYQKINQALMAVSYMSRPNNERVTIVVDPANYEEMLVINLPNITLKNASISPSTALLNNGLDISPNAVRITSYYGHGYNYYSMGPDNKWRADVLNVSLENGQYSYPNAGSGTTNGSFWNATVVVRANGFEAEGIIFENSFNQYISQKESQDIVVMWPTTPQGIRPTDFGNLNVQQRTFVERAAALAIANNTDKVILNKCRVVGRQDSFFGGNNVRAVIYKGEVMGAVDFIFGGMTAVFYKTDLVMNTSDASNDVAYITAAQQSTGRGYLMYECKISSTNPNEDTNSNSKSKPGYFGRPWLANTSEVVFYNTTIETTNYPSNNGQSLILPLGWQNSLGGTSPGMYEYGTIELSGVNNTPNRASWSTSLSSPILNDGTPISTFNFTKGNDDWDPLPNLIANDPLSNSNFPNEGINIFAINDTVFFSQIKELNHVEIFDLKGLRYKKFDIQEDNSIKLPEGLWLIVCRSNNKISKSKVLINVK